MQGPIELPASVIYPDNFLSFPLPPIFPFNLPNWPYPPNVFGTVFTPSSPSNPAPVTPTNIAATIQERVGKENLKNNRHVAADIDAIIESEILSSNYSTLNPVDLKQHITDALLIERYDLFVTADTQSKSLLGHNPMWRSNDLNVAIYTQLYGDPQLDISLFEQRMEEAFKAANDRSWLVLDVYYLSLKSSGSSIDDVRAKVNARAAAEAAASAEAERIAAEAKIIKLANTYPASGTLAVAESLIIIPAAGALVSNAADFQLRVIIKAAIAALGGFAASVGTGLAIGVSALFYSTSLGSGELPRRYCLQTPLSDVDPQLSADLIANEAVIASHVNLPYRFSSQLTAEETSEIFAIKTDGQIVPSQVQTLNALYDARQNIYTATTTDIPARTLTWTPIVTSSDNSTVLPASQSTPPSYAGTTLKPIELRVETYPGVSEASWDDYVIIFPAESGLPPIYTMFRDRREEAGTASGSGVHVGDDWAKGVETRDGAPIPTQIADSLRGQQFRN